MLCVSLIAHISVSAHVSVLAMHMAVVLVTTVLSDMCMRRTSAPPSVMRLLERSKDVRNLFFCKASDICNKHQGLMVKCRNGVLTLHRGDQEPNVRHKRGCASCVTMIRIRAKRPTCLAFESRKLHCESLTQISSSSLLFSCLTAAAILHCQGAI